MSKKGEKATKKLQKSDKLSLFKISSVAFCRPPKKAIKSDKRRQFVAFYFVAAHPRLKTFMKFGGETRAKVRKIFMSSEHKKKFLKMLDFVNSGEHLPIEENENLILSESQIYDTESDTEPGNVHLIRTPKRKFDQLKKVSF